MKQFISSALVVSALCVSETPAFAADASEAVWQRLIRANFDASCAVEKQKVGTVVFGNNGYHSEQWFMHTCQGSYEYFVEYYPPSTFPDRASPYQVERINPKPEDRQINP